MHTNTSFRRINHSQGHTLIEMLVVMAVMGILAVAAAPSIDSIFSTGFNGNVSILDQALQQARSYAMANNTCVYVGLDEVSATSSTPSPGTGRIVVSLTALNDGSNGITGSDGSLTFNASALTQISQLISISNVHIADLTSVTTGNMTRPDISTITSSINLATTPSDRNMAITYPLASSGQTALYTFPYVIGFDPNGAAFYITNLTSQSSTSPNVIPYIEIGLQPTHGETVPSALNGNMGVIQLDGLSGITHIYRP